MKLKIFYFIADVYPAWRYDVVELFGVELPKRDIDVTWCMRRGAAGFCTRAEQAGQTAYLPASLGRATALRRLLNRPIEALCEAWWFLVVLLPGRYDIIQVRDDRYLAAFWAWLAARLTGAQFTYWLSFPFPENDAEKAERSSGIARLLLRLRSSVAGFWLYRFILHRADFIFVQSEAMRDSLVAYGVAKDKMLPVPMGVPASMLAWAEVSDIPVKPGLIAYIGTLAASRRLEMIIEAFALVREKRHDVMLAVVGEGDVPAERLALEALAKLLGVEGHIRFTGWLPVRDAWRIAAEAEIGLSPIFPDRVLRMGSPTKLVEFMALGRPVVASEQPEQRQVIDMSGAGLCVAWSARAHAEAILDLLGNNEIRLEMGARGRAWIAANRCYDAVAYQVWLAYCKLLGERR